MKKQCKVYPEPTPFNWIADGEDGWTCQLCSGHKSEDVACELVAGKFQACPQCVEENQKE